MKKLLTLILAIGMSACSPSGASDSEDAGALFALLALSGSSLSDSSDSSSTSSGTTCAGGSLSSATSLSNGNSAAGTLSSSSDVHVYSFSANSTAKYLLFLHTVDSGLNVTLTICNSNGTSLATYNNNGNGGAEGSIGGQFTAIATYYLAVSGTAAGSYRIDTEDDNFGTGASVSGGGSCTGWNGSLASECLNFDADFQNPSAYCTTSLSGSYSSGSCTTASLQGRCTGYLGSTSGAGYISVLGYTGDFASDSSMQTWCNSALGSGQYLYNSNNF